MQLFARPAHARAWRAASSSGRPAFCAGRSVQCKSAAVQPQLPSMGMDYAVSAGILEPEIALCNGPRGRGLCISPDSATAAATQPTQQADTSKQQAMPPMPDPSISVTFADALVISTNSEEVQERVLQRWQECNAITMPAALLQHLKDINNPPAMRIVAWFAWAYQHAPRFRAYCLQWLGPITQPHSLLRVPDHVIADAVSQDPRLGDFLRQIRKQVLDYTTVLQSRGLDGGLSTGELWWLFDLVTSRAFQVSSPWLSADGEAQMVSLSLYVPWADLVNHTLEPNAIFGVEFEGPPPEPWDEPSNDPRVINSAHGSPKVSGGGRFVVARRSRWTPLAAGQELLLCYGDGLSNRQLLLKYGFAESYNPNDRLLIPKASMRAAAGGREPSQALADVAESVSDSLPAGRQGVAYAALASILMALERESASSVAEGPVQPPQTAPSSIDTAASKQGLREVLAWLADERSTDAIAAEAASQGASKGASGAAGDYGDVFVQADESCNHVRRSLLAYAESRASIKEVAARIVKAWLRPKPVQPLAV